MAGQTDNSPSAESTSLNTDSAASVFAEIFEPKKEEKKVEADSKDDAIDDAALQAQAEADEAAKLEAEAKPEDVQKFTVKIDGKDVELSEADIAEAYKNGLRQSDYTKKTMEAAETRKTAEAEITHARNERNAYAQKLSEQTVILQNALEQQSQIDWQQLLDTDPMEYLKQQHLYQSRHVAFQKAQGEQQVIYQQQQQEQAEYAQKFITEQRESLLAKLPEWKDAKKAESEKGDLRTYLQAEGFEDGEIGQIVDARTVVVARKAMLYDKMMEKAKAAAKKVSNIPQRVERSGSGTAQPMDKRSAAYQQLNKSGSVKDAAAVFASFI